MRRSRVILPLIVLAVLTSSLALGPLNYALAQEGRGDEKKATSEKVIVIMSKAREHVEETFAKLEERGVKIPEAAREGVRAGASNAEEAVRASREGRIDEANDAALRAMGEFKKSMQLLGAANLTAAVSAKQGIEQAVSRAQVFLKNLQAPVEKAEELGYSTTALRERIPNANATLNEALDLVGRGMVDDAAKKLGEARRIIAGLTGEINRIARDEAGERVEKFAENALKGLNELQNKTDELEISPHAAAAVKSARDNAKSHMEKAKKLAEEKDVKEAVKELEDMTKEVKKGADRLREEYPAVANRLKATIKQLEVRIDALEKQLERLKGRMEVAEANEKLQEVKDLLKQADKDLEDKEVEDANKAVKKAGTLVESVEGLVKEAAKKQGEGERRNEDDKGQRRAGM